MSHKVQDKQIYVSIKFQTVTICLIVSVIRQSVSSFLAHIRYVSVRAERRITILKLSWKFVVRVQNLPTEI